MKNITSRITILVFLIGILIMTSGCSHQIVHKHKKSYTALPPAVAESQFLQDLANLPADQRNDYVEAHLDVLDIFKMDPDKSKMDQINSLVPPKVP